MGSKSGSRKLLGAIWVLAAIGGIALFEWDMTPSSGRHKAGGQSAGPGPARYLVLREWRRNTDYQFVPSAERKRYPDGGLQETYQLATDKDGFVEPARRHAQPDLSLIFLGGSTTECMYVTPDNRFPHLTATKLEQALGLKVNGINAAISGNNSMHSLLLLLGKVVPLRPDFVILMHGINDIGTLRSNGTYWIKDGSLRLFEEEKTSVGDAGKMLVRTSSPTRRSSCSTAPRRCACSCASAPLGYKRRNRPARRIGGRRWRATSRARSGPSCGSQPPGASRRCS